MRFVLPRLRRKMIRAKLGVLPFGVVSNNCWGSHIYQAAEMQYTTPFVGLFLSPTAYVHLLRNWMRLIHSPLEFRDKSSEECVENIRRLRETLWPVGVLGGEVEVQFMHYKNSDEARLKWESRLKRMPIDLNRLFFKFDDREGCVAEQMKLFASLPFPHKVLFTAKSELIDLDCAIQIRCPQSIVPDGVTLSRLSPRYFDSAAWIGGRRQPGSKLLSFV
jgi:uncharacterized protein (DUF1919 family)